MLSPRDQLRSLVHLVSGALLLAALLVPALAPVAAPALLGGILLDRLLRPA